MKICRDCTEFACGQCGASEISMFCGDKNQKVVSYVFTDSYEKAVNKINELAFQSDYHTTTIQTINSFDKYIARTEKEIWKWSRSNFTGKNIMKAYIDKDLSFRVIIDDVLPMCKNAVEIHYF